MSTASSDIGTLVLCLWATWFGGLLLIPSGLYFMRTGRSVIVHTPLGYRRTRDHAYPPRPPKSAYEVRIEHGPRVRQQGRNMVLFGIVMLIIFTVLSVSFWTTAQDGSSQMLVLMGMLLELPVIWYFVTTGGRRRG